MVIRRTTTSTCLSHHQKKWEVDSLYLPERRLQNRLERRGLFTWWERTCEKQRRQLGIPRTAMAAELLCMISVLGPLHSEECRRRMEAEIRKTPKGQVRMQDFENRLAVEVEEQCRCLKPIDHSFCHLKPIDSPPAIDIDIPIRWQDHEPWLIWLSSVSILAEGVRLDSVHLALLVGY